MQTRQARPFRLRSCAVIATVSACVAGLLVPGALPAAAQTGPGTDPEPRQLLAGAITTVDLLGSVPDGAVAVALNVTATESTAAGYVTLFPCGGTVPPTSNLNYRAFETVANAAVVPLGSGGDICIYTHSPVNVILDVTGWFASGSLSPAGPERVLDTRATGQRLTAATLDVAVPLVAMPATARAVAVNLTVTGPEGAGYATLFSCGAPLPLASNSNFVAGQTVATAAIVAVESGRPLCLHSSVGADVIVDVFGWLGADGMVASSPLRLFDSRQGQPIAAGATLPVSVPGAAGASAALNVTAIPSGEAGYLTVYPCDGPMPATSTVNYVARVVPNLAVSLVASDERVCIFSSAPAHVVVDWFGTLPTGRGFTGIDPVRVLDTRLSTEQIPIPLPSSSGASGPAVVAIQQRLTDLGFWLGAIDGGYGFLTRQAVMAFQKYVGLPRTGTVDQATIDALAEAAPAQALTTAGDILEVDKARQLVFVVGGGRTIAALNASTGSEVPYRETLPDGRVATGDAITYSGRFSINRQRDDGWHESELGQLWRPKYFHGGIAFHGSTSIPANPASHGCVRLSVPAMDWVWTHNLMPIGRSVWVY